MRTKCDFPRLILRMLLLCVAVGLRAGTLSACTTAVISGKATRDGRPILWKNRDNSSSPRNEVVLLEKGKYRAVAVVNAGSRSSVWMGVNEAGFCIENSLCKDLAIKEKTQGLGNGGFMKLALESCATVSDFEKLLEGTNKSGRKTTACFGVIDAQGGAALFEAGPCTFVKFDANDPKVAPDGLIVRSNFTMSANNLPGIPKAERVVDLYSGRRYLRACALLKERGKGKVDVAYVLRNLTRDMADDAGHPHPGSVNGPSGPLPRGVATGRTLSRISTVSAAVFHGVQPGENPLLSTMWTILGDPKFSLAVPCWAGCRAVADPLEGGQGGEIGEIARTLRDWSRGRTEGEILTRGLPGIWTDLWKVEDELIKEGLKAREAWAGKKPIPAAMTELHRELAERAMRAMRQELCEAKEAALAGPASPTSAPERTAIRVAIYDHSTGTANGPKNLLRFLTAENGFEAERIRPEEIGEGGLTGFDVLIMPGGSGSLQSKKLGAAGREAVRRFVRRGGGYVGICAGSYLASAHYSWSLDLINARVWDRAHWARGTGTVRLCLSESGVKALDVKRKEMEVYYGQGPLLVPGDHPGLPRYETLATYRSEVAKKGALEGAMTGTHAIIRAGYGAGRVLCFSPHPETKSGPNRMVVAGVKWAAGQVNR